MYSCKQECLEWEDPAYYLSPGLKSSVPYQEGQMVNFDRAGEVYSFEVTKVEVDTMKSFYNFREGYCADSIFLFEETFHTELYDSVHHVKFAFNANVYNPSMYVSVYPLASGQHENASTDLFYHIDSLENFVCDYSPYTMNGTICHDTITIGSTLYHDVAELSSNSGWLHAIRKVFYSQEKGILKVTFRASFNEEFVLIE